MLYPWTVWTMSRIGSSKDLFTMYNEIIAGLLWDIHVITEYWVISPV